MTVTASTDVSFDAALAQMPVLLDPHAVAPILARSLPAPSVDVEIRFLRYKPGTNLVVHYQVDANGVRRDAVVMIASKANLARRASKPENVALAQRAAARTPAVMPLSYDDETRCLVQWYPVDISLPALALAPRDLRRQIGGAGLATPLSDNEPEQLAYKPRRRAVLKLDGYVLKLYAHDQEFERAAQGQRSASTLRTVPAPVLEAVLPEQLVTVQSALGGETVHAPMELAVHAGALLAQLHTSDVPGLRVFDAVHQLAAAAASARLVAAIAPHLRSRVERLLRILGRSRPTDERLVPSHGDYNVRQLLVTDEHIAITDFDPFCLAGAALDPATYAAYLVRGGADDLHRALAALADLVAGYRTHPPHLDWYLATMILRRAPRPFRYFEVDWRQRVEEMVRSAQAVLEP